MFVRDEFGVEFGSGVVDLHVEANPLDERRLHRIAALGVCDAGRVEKWALSELQGRGGDRRGNLACAHRVGRLDQTEEVMAEKYASELDWRLREAS